MAVEIERKFLVDASRLPTLPDPIVMKQGYIPSSGVTVRVRLAGNHAFLTLKGRTRGVTRSEFEYAVPPEDADAMLEELCMHPLIEKKRYLIDYEGHRWELDIFEGENAGLMVAEIELGSEEETFAKPEWVTEDVSGDFRYRNAALVKYPYSRWESHSSARPESV